MVAQCKPKQVLDYIRDHCPRESTGNNQKGKKGKAKGRTKHNSGDADSEVSF